MKKIKQLSFVLFIFSVLAFSYPVTQVFAQGGAGMNGGECDPNPACVENCCNECDPNPACVENCCPAESPENPNNDPGSSGSSDTATFCPNCGPDSLGQRNNIPRKPTGNITRNPRSNILRKPTGKIMRKPSGTITRKSKGRVMDNPVSNVAPTTNGIDANNLSPSALGHSKLCDKLRAEALEAFDKFNTAWTRAYSMANQTFLQSNGELLDTSAYVFIAPLVTGRKLLRRDWDDFEEVMLDIRERNYSGQVLHFGLRCYGQD